MQPHNTSLENVLSQVSTAAKTGQLDAIEALNAQLEEALTTLPEDEEELLQLRAKAAETAALLSACIKGIMSARQRLQEVRQIRQGVGTYGQDGQRQQLAQNLKDVRRV